MECILSTKNICRKFKVGKETVTALKNVNIKVNKGTLTILRGRSGSGKTTLLNLLGGLDDPTSGKIFFKDNEITAMTISEKENFRRTKIGFVFQSHALISLMNVYENVEFPLRLTDMKQGERKENTIKYLKMVGLSERINHMPYELSGGEQQRVAIARAIAHKSELIFADEPTAELDTYTGLQVVNIFKKLVKDEGLTVVMTTHDPDMMEIADYVYTLEDGVIIDGK